MPRIDWFVLFIYFQLYSSHYIYKVANKLKGAEKILNAMGYTIPQGFNELKYKGQVEGEVDLKHILRTAADLIVLHCDLDILKGNVIAIRNQDLQQVILTDILKARSIEDQVYQETYEAAVSIANERVSCQPQRSRYGQNMIKTDKDQVKYHSDLASQCGSREIWEERRRGSAPLLDQSEPVHNFMCQPQYDLPPHDEEWCSTHKRHSDSNLLDRVDPVNVLRKGKSTDKPLQVDPCIDNTERGINVTRSSAQFYVGSPISSDQELSILPSLPPPPNPDDLPAPFIVDEAEFSADAHRLQLNFRHSSNRANLYVNPSSDDNFFSTSDEMGSTFSPDDLERVNCGIVHDPTANILKMRMDSLSADHQFDNAKSSHADYIANKHTSSTPFGATGNPANLWEGNAIRSKQQTQECFGSEITGSDTKKLQPTEIDAHKSETGPIVEQQEKLKPSSNSPKDFRLAKSKTKEGDFEVVTTLHKRKPEDSTASIDHKMKYKDEIVDGFVIIPESMRNRSDHIKAGSQKDYIQELNHSKASLDAGGELNVSQTWICNYCTNINMVNETKCEICGVRNNSATQVT